MKELKRLPDSEFEIIKAIWDMEPPVTTKMLMEAIGNKKGWKMPSVISFLNRLIDKGFLSTDKNGKERTYFPLISKEEYLKFESENFMKSHHGNSILSLVNTLYRGKKLTQEEIDELEKIINKGRK